MNTIKVYLKPSGSLAEMFKDFDIYVGSYRNVEVEVYVPTSVLYENQENTLNTAIKLGGLLTAENGDRTTTKAYYLRYLGLKTVRDEITHTDVEYAVYQKLLPKEFTLYAGNQTMVFNVVLVDNTNKNKPVILEIIDSQPTQTAILEVKESDYIDTEEVVEPSEFEVLESRVNGNESDIINLKTRMTTAETNLVDNTQNIAQNMTDIAELKQIIGMGENFIGTMKGSALPTNQQLADFVYQEQQRLPVGGDAVVFVLEIQDDTDKNYKYIFNGTVWKYFEIPPMEEAMNGTMGIIEGTYGIGLDYNTLVNIVGGQIHNIYVKDDAGEYRDIHEYANTLNTNVEDLISGNTQVGFALRALQDANGNNIVNTYLTQNAGATKQYVQDYSLPRQFNDVNYIGRDGYSTDIPSGDIQFSLTTGAVGDFELFNISKTAGAKYQISNKNSYSNVIFVSSTVDSSVQFRLTTTIKGELANIELTDIVNLRPGTITRVNFENTFDYLNEKVLKIEESDIISQMLEIITTSSEVATYSVYSNSIYPSKLYLRVQSQVVKITQGMLGEIQVIESPGLLEDGIITFSLDNENIIQNTLNEFVLTYVGEIVNGTELQFDKNGQKIRIINTENVLSGNSKIEDLGIFKSYKDNITTLKFVGLVKIENGEIEVYVINGGGSVDLTQYVKDTDYAVDNGEAGIIKTIGSTYGVRASTDGLLFVDCASQPQILAKTTAFRPIAPNNLDYAVKVGLTTNTETLTDEEKAAAQNWLGTFNKPKYTSGRRRFIGISPNADGGSEVVVEMSGSAAIPTGSAVPVANNVGNIAVAAPTENNHAANKGYVDEIKATIPTFTATQLEDGSYSLTIGG